MSTPATSANTTPPAPLDYPAFDQLATRAVALKPLLESTDASAKQLGRQLLSKLQTETDRQYPADKSARLAAATVRRQNTTTFYHQTWATIHTRAIGHTPGADDSQFFRDVATALKKNACPVCRQNFLAYFGYDPKTGAFTKPPDFSSALSYFTATVDLHNSINIQNGGTVMTLADAWQLYAPQVPGAPAALPVK